MVFPFNIHRLNFKDTNYLQGSHLEITLSNVTILVGPNNSGKSQVLKDIENFCFNDKSEMQLLSEVQFTVPSEDLEIEELFNRFKIEPPKNSNLQGYQIYLTSPNLREEGRELTFVIDTQEHMARIRQRKTSGVRPELTSLFTARLDGRTRFNLVNSREIGSLNRPRNFLSALYLKDKERERLREITHTEFGLYCYLDASEGTLQIKMSPDKISSEEERSLVEKTFKFFSNAIPIDRLGDGIQAFVGLLLAVSSLEHRILLVDEPEAFLHPPQANHLGGYLTEFSKERGGSLVVATHSVDFLIGCLEKSSDVTILRLTYDGKIGTLRQLTSDDVMKFMRDSLLRSTDTLNALFHKSAIITESDGDRVFYSEINRKLQAKKLGIDDTIFLNSHGKTDIHRIAGALRKIGIPAVCIYDLDIVKVQKNQWEEMLGTMNVPEAEILQFEEGRKFVLDEIQKLKKDGEPDPFTRQGLPALNGVSKTRSYDFINGLTKYGIFVIDIGELEQWLKSFGVGAGNKADWLTGMLDKLDVLDPSNINPSEDVWIFLKKIADWIQDSNRKGM